MSPIERPDRDHVLVFAERNQLRTWLEANHETASEAFIGYYRKGVGKSSTTWAQAVEEALCFGWIDGITFRIDDEVTANRFTPRRKGSSWSAVNIAKVAELRAAGRMHPAGIRAFEEWDRRKDQGYLFERPAQELPPDLVRVSGRNVQTTRLTAGPSRDNGRMTDTPAGVRLTRMDAAHTDEVLTPEALDFVAQLHRNFDQERLRLLRDRAARQARFDAGELPDFKPNPIESEDPDWRVAPAPPDFDDRRVEITGPAEPKMMINALNSGASVFMCDFEDALSPTWDNVVTGQWAVNEAVRRRLRFETDEKAYELNDEIATLCIRPRGWHLDEAHVLVDGKPMAASIFDFGIWFFHNARELLDRGSGPYLYLPKLESHLEAHLWNEVFEAAQHALDVPHGSIRATVLIETILAAFEMDEILYELRDHAAGLNAGRWDYIFSIIKKFRAHPDKVLPDRAQVTMTVPFMRAYTELLVRTCHRRGAHAIGGMAAFIPSRRDPEVNDRAIAAVRADKERESSDGFDGTWVAHPDLVPLAREVFDGVLGDRPHQKDRLRDDVRVTAGDLLDVRVPNGSVTEAGVRANVSVGLAYLASWLAGNGAAAINNLMEDAATAEISRSQLWQWRTQATPLDDGQPLTTDRYAVIRDEELGKLRSLSPDSPWTDAAALLDELVLSEDFVEFLTLSAYPRLA